MRARLTPSARFLGAIGLLGVAVGSSVGAFLAIAEKRLMPKKPDIKVGAIDAVLTVPSGVERPPVALLIAGSGSTDHDGNGPQIKPATLKKLSEQLVSRQDRDASLRQARRGRMEAAIRHGRKIFVSRIMSMMPRFAGELLARQRQSSPACHSWSATAKADLVGDFDGASRARSTGWCCWSTAARRQGDLAQGAA